MLQLFNQLMFLPHSSPARIALSCWKRLIQVCGGEFSPEQWELTVKTFLVVMDHMTPREILEMPKGIQNFHVKKRLLLKRCTIQMHICDDIANLVMRYYDKL